MRSVRSVWLVVVVLALSGCGKTMTEEDCQQVADHLRQVWDEEAKKAAPADGPASDKAAAVVRSGGDKLVADWMTECKKELAGRRVDPAEMKCLLEAKSIEQINRCAEL